jgi:hypothetical protein
MRYQSRIDFGLMDWLLRKVFGFKAGIPSLSSGRISYSAGSEEAAHHAMDCFFSTSPGPLADTDGVRVSAWERIGKELTVEGDVSENLGLFTKSKS